MPTEIPHTPSDAQLLHVYLGQQLDRAGDQLSLDEALAGFQEYYRQLNLLRGKIECASASLERGAGSPLDADAVIGQIRQRLSELRRAE
jgi:hypothetical protein